jgi:hypothetical protein
LWCLLTPARKTAAWRCRPKGSKPARNRDASRSSLKGRPHGVRSPPAGDSALSGRDYRPAARTRFW